MHFVFETFASETHRALSLRHGGVVSLHMRSDGASGWVDYVDEGGAASALETLDETDILGIELRLSRGEGLSQPQEQGQEQGQGKGPLPDVSGSVGDQPKKRARTTSGR